jgi:hypothetical protein
MMSRTNARLLQSSALILLISALGCFGSGPGRMMRNGEDVLIAGGSPFVRSLDSIPGDAILTGGEITFEGAAGGDYLGAGGTQKIGGRVHGSVRSVGGEIHALGTVDRNTTIAGGNVNIDSTGVIGGNAYVTGGSVSVAGTVKGSLLASGGAVTIIGSVGRDVEVAAGGLHIGPHAQIAGNLRYRVPKDKVTIDKGAQIGGSITALPVENKPLGGLLWMLGFVVAAIFLVALFPGVSIGSAEVLHQRPGRSGLVGLGWVLLVPIAAIIAAVTIIGLPLAFIAVAAWLLLAFVGDVPVALWIGKKLLGARAAPGRNGAILCVFVGGLIIVAIGLVPVLGTIITFIAGVFGIGAILLRLRTPAAAEPVYSI